MGSTPLLVVSEMAYLVALFVVIQHLVWWNSIAFAVTLAAVWIATAPVAQPLLDVTARTKSKGTSCLIYAPGFTLLLMGLLLGLSVEGGLQVLHGRSIFGFCIVTLGDWCDWMCVGPQALPPAIWCGPLRFCMRLT